MRKQFLVLLLAGLAVFQTAQAGRVLPQNAQSGTLRGHEYPMVNIDGTAYRLAPGAVIFDQFNRTVLSGFVPASASIFYQVDNQGQISKIWLMTPEEQAGSR